MNTTNAASLARTLMNEHGFGHWTFEFDRAKRRAGLCRHRLQIISLSHHYVVNNNAEDVKDTILHEIAHAIAGPGHGHSRYWKSICIRIGAKPERLCSNAIMPKGQWQAHCPKCQKEFYRHRKPKYNGYTYCRACGPTNGSLTYRKAI